MNLTEIRKIVKNEDGERGPRKRTFKIEATTENFVIVVARGKSRGHHSTQHFADLYAIHLPTRLHCRFAGFCQVSMPVRCKIGEVEEIEGGLHVYLAVKCKDEFGIEVDWPKAHFCCGLQLVGWHL